MSDVFIVDAIRTPIGRGKSDGALHHVHPVDLLAQTLEALMAHACVDKRQVEDIVTGCVTALGEQGTNIGRLAGLKAGFPVEVPALQLNRFCGSGQQAIHFAAQAIAAGDMEMAIGCGVESMSRVPMGSDSAITDEFRAEFPLQLLHQGVSEVISEGRARITGRRRGAGWWRFWPTCRGSRRCRKTGASGRDLRSCRPGWGG